MNSTRQCIVICLLSCFVLISAEAQEKSVLNKSNIIEQLIEQLVENAQEEELDYTTLFDNLSYYFEHSLNLNNATKSELEQLYLLNDFQIQSLLNHIEKNGKLLNIYELQVIPGFDVDVIQSVLPFVRVSQNLGESNLSWKELFTSGQHEWFVRYTRIIEEQKGFSDISPEELAENPNSRFLGSQDKLMTRYRFKYLNKISCGITGEKDAGEEFFQGTQVNGFDFYSAHFFAKDFGRIKSFVVGDYQLQVGQGLNFWSGLAFGKSIQTMNFKRNSQGIRPYTSVDENLFLRGSAVTLGFDKIEFTAFYSSKQNDGNIIEITDSLNANFQEQTISSLQLSGFHRTLGELFDKNAIQEHIYGGRVVYKMRKFSLGATASRVQYDQNIDPRQSIYNQFDFNSNENVVGGTDYQWRHKNMSFFGEISRSQNGGMAYLNGVLMVLDPRLSFSIYHRNFQQDYQNLYSNAFRERSKTQNERGLYFGISAKPSQKVTLNAYFDQFKFPWMQFRVDQPATSGYDGLVYLQYKPSRKMMMYFRYRHRSRPINEDAAHSIDQVVQRLQSNYRFNITYKINKQWQLGNRADWSIYQEEGQSKQNGFLIYQDIKFKPMFSKFSFVARYVLFDADSYDARIYTYENDVPYLFSIPAFYNRGTRTYLMIRYRLLRDTDLWMRYGLTNYDNINVISSGLNEIQGNKRSDIKLQLRVKF